VNKKTDYDPACKNRWANYYSGGIQSLNHDYSYGYFEIYAKLPGFYDNGISDGEGFWPAFWTCYVETDINGCRMIHDEIDILEPSGIQYADAKSNVAGWHDEHPDCDTNNVKVSGHVWYTHSQPLFDDYHKYAVEWLPDRIIFYFDDLPFYIEYNHPKMVMRPQYVVIDQQMDNNTSVNPNMPFPQYMSVDYFRYYELNDSYCG
jgi:beta-glucanase (GH16 family)